MVLANSENSILGLNVMKIANLVYLSIIDPPDSHIPQQQFDAKPAMLIVDRSLKVSLFPAFHQLKTPYYGFCLTFQFMLHLEAQESLFLAKLGH